MIAAAAVVVGLALMVTAVLVLRPSPSEQAGPAPVTSPGTASSGGPQTFPPGASPTTPDPVPTVTPPAGAGKRPLLGLGDRGPYGTADEMVDVPRDAVLRELGFVSVTARWRDLQPNGPEEMRYDRLDDALAQVVDADPTRRVKVRLRVFAGAFSPDWLKKRTGTVALRNDAFARTGQVPQWWEPEMAQAYAQLQQQLAARYDDPQAPGASPYADLISEVVVSMTSVFYPEPLLRHLAAQAGGESNQQALLRSTYTREADLAAIRASFDAHRVWRKTLTHMAFNPYQWLETDRARTRVTRMQASDVSVTLQLMDDLRERLGSRAVLANYSLRPQFTRAGHYQRLYRHMLDHPVRGPVAFQTQAESGPTGGIDAASLREVVDWVITTNESGVRNKITSLELPRIPRVAPGAGDADGSDVGAARAAPEDGGAAGRSALDPVAVLDLHEAGRRMLGTLD